MIMEGCRVRSYRLTRYVASARQNVYIQTQSARNAALSAPFEVGYVMLCSALAGVAARRRTGRIGGYPSIELNVLSSIEPT